MYKVYIKRTVYKYLHYTPPHPCLLYLAGYVQSTHPHRRGLRASVRAARCRRTPAGAHSRGSRTARGRDPHCRSVLKL